MCVINQMGGQRVYNAKTYTVDNNCFFFDKCVFNSIFLKRKGDKKVGEYEEILADLIGISASTIHSWRVGESSPSDIEKIIDVASVFDLNDYKTLLKKKEGVVTMQITDRQKDSIKRIYDAVVVFFDTFDKTDGFNSYWHKICGMYKCDKEVQNALYDIADAEHEKVRLVLKKEYIELFRLDLYEKLEEYVYDYILDTYADEKSSYAYRFEAGVEKIDGTRDTLTTDEEITKAMKVLHELLEPYM